MRGGQLAYSDMTDSELLELAFATPQHLSRLGLHTIYTPMAAQAEMTSRRASAAIKGSGIVFGSQI